MISLRLPVPASPRRPRLARAVAVGGISLVALALAVFAYAAQAQTATNVKCPRPCIDKKELKKKAVTKKKLKNRSVSEKKLDKSVRERIRSNNFVATISPG